MTNISTNLSLLENVDKKVNEEMNNLVFGDYTEEDVFNAISQMNPAKAPLPQMAWRQCFIKNTGRLFGKMFLMRS